VAVDARIGRRNGIRPRRLTRADDVAWALLDDEVGPPEVIVPLRDGVVDADGIYPLHCPVCDRDQPMQSAVTSQGVRYERCLGCGLLWHVDLDVGVIEGVRMVESRRAQRT
jgi:hypothetical protein